MPSVMDGHKMFLQGFLSPYHGIYHVSKNASLLQWATAEQQVCLSVLGHREQGHSMRTYTEAPLIHMHTEKPLCCAHTADFIPTPVLELL